jgi:hypothetical protein
MIQGRAIIDNPDAAWAGDYIHRISVVSAAEAWTLGQDWTMHQHVVRFAAPSPYLDVDPGNPFYGYILDLGCRNIVDGYPDSTFHPFDTIARGTVAEWVVKTRGWAEDLTGAPHFTDVPATDPFYSVIETAYNHGVLSGYADHTFRLAAPITRGQMSKMVVLAFGWTPDPSGGPVFRDVDASNPFYAQISTIYAHGLVSGYDCGPGCLDFNWGGFLTRGQFAKVLANALSER